MTLPNELVMTTSTIQVLVLLGWFGVSSNIHPITVCHLSSSEPHGFGPNIVSQLSCDNLSPFEKPWSRVLSIILDSPILSAMEVSILKISSKCWYHGDTEVIRFSISSRLGKLPELVIMVLWSYQGGDHGECSFERSVSSSIDKDLISQSCSIAGASNVDIIHVSLWDLCSNLSNEIKNKLDVISFALLCIHIPTSFIAIWCHN